jgi:phosphoribosyl-ATP pyrophosphohydrolase
LHRRLDEIASAPEPASNTGKLFDDPALLGAKLVEEAGELASVDDSGRVVSEAADLLYFLIAKLVSAGVTLGEVEAELDRRERRVSRRPMRPKGAS